MAREESDREDILREATALVERAELRIDGVAEPLVFGFRANGALSLFVTQDEVYHFDAEGAWRRGYFQGRLLKAVRGQMVELIRERTEQATVLRSRPLSSREQAEHEARWARRRTWLREAMDEGRCERVGVISASGADPVALLAGWIMEKADPLRIADRPHLR